MLIALIYYISHISYIPLIKLKPSKRIMPSLLLNSILKRSKDSIKESLINESLSCKRNFKKSNLIYCKKLKKSKKLKNFKKSKKSKFSFIILSLSCKRNFSIKFIFYKNFLTLRVSVLPPHS